MRKHGKRAVNRRLHRVADLLPSWPARLLHWLAGPNAGWLCIPLAIVLTIVGLFGFLPGLGYWMLVIGLLLLSKDVPFLRKPMLKLCVWIEHVWQWLCMKLIERGLIRPRKRARNAARSA